MKGRCLCGEVEFELSGKIPNLYQCHCSLCRKASGSSSNAALLISREQFRWKSGENSISSYKKIPGFTSDFCSKCGSPLPKPVQNGKAVWVPVGLLEDDQKLSLVAHIYVGSKAEWDDIADSATHFETMPEIETLNKMLQK